MAKTIDKQTMLDLIVEAKRTDPETGSFAEWLAEYLAEHLPTLTPPNEWVSVENAVPDPGERVLATDGTFVGEAYRTSANTWYRHTSFPWRDCLQSIVTLWMPLPTADKDNHVPAKAPNEPLTIEQLRKMNGKPAYWLEDDSWGIISVDSTGSWKGMPFFRGRKGEVNFEYDIEKRGMEVYACQLHELRPVVHGH